MKKYSRQRNVDIQTVVGAENKAIKQISLLYEEELTKAINALIKAFKRNNIKITHKRKGLFRQLLSSKTGLNIYIWDEHVGLNKKTIETKGKGYVAEFIELTIWFSLVFDNEETNEYIEDYYGDIRNEYWIYSKEELDRRMKRIKEIDEKVLELEFSRDIKDVKGLISK